MNISEMLDALEMRVGELLQTNRQLSAQLLHQVADAVESIPADETEVEMKRKKTTDAPSFGTLFPELQDDSGMLFDEQQDELAADDGTEEEDEGLPDSEISASSVPGTRKKRALSKRTPKSQAAVDAPAATDAPEWVTSNSVPEVAPAEPEIGAASEMVEVVASPEVAGVAAVSDLDEQPIVLVESAPAPASDAVAEIPAVPVEANVDSILTVEAEPPPEESVVPASNADAALMAAAEQANVTAGQDAGRAEKELAWPEPAAAEAAPAEPSRVEVLPARAVPTARKPHPFAVQNVSGPKTNPASAASLEKDPPPPATVSVEPPPAVVKSATARPAAAANVAPPPRVHPFAVQSVRTTEPPPALQVQPVVAVPQQSASKTSHFVPATAERTVRPSVRAHPFAVHSGRPQASLPEPEVRPAIAAAPAIPRSATPPVNGLQGSAHPFAQAVGEVRKQVAAAPESPAAPAPRSVQHPFAIESARVQPATAAVTPVAVPPSANRTQRSHPFTEVGPNGLQTNVPTQRAAVRSDVHWSFPAEQKPSIRADVLRSHMQKSGLTRDEVAGSFGVTLAVVDSWLSGGAAIPSSVLSSLRVLELLSPQARRQTRKRSDAIKPDSQVRKTVGKEHRHPFAKIEEL